MDCNPADSEIGERSYVRGEKTDEKNIFDLNCINDMHDFIFTGAHERKSAEHGIGTVSVVRVSLYHAMCQADCKRRKQTCDLCELLCKGERL